MGERRSRGPYAKTAQRRSDILDAAQASFVERGYEAASLRNIAERAGISYQGLLHHFPSKEALLVGLLARRDEQEYERAGPGRHRHAHEHEHEHDHDDGRGHGGERDRGPRRQAGRSRLDELLLDHQREPELMRLWLELTVAAARREHPAHEYFTERYVRTRSVLAARMAAGMVGGPLAPGVPPEAAAALFAAVLDGLQMQWLLDPELDVIAAFRVFRDLLAGRRPGPPENGPCPTG